MMKQTSFAALTAFFFITSTSAIPVTEITRSTVPECASSASECSRDSLTSLVTQILDSMVAKDPSTLPLASVYKATENSHPAALSFMTSWRTITKTGAPSVLALDTQQCSAYFALDISEGSDATQNVLRGRVKAVDQKISELELFINRNRGDHGFSFSAADLATNNAALMSPPANRVKPSRETLEALSHALFASSSDFEVEISDSCQFSEIGWKVIDTGVYGNASSDPLSCGWPDQHPTDDTARTALVVDEELGFVLTSGMVPGKVYPYNGGISAFIPNQMTAAQDQQDDWIKTVSAQGNVSLLAPTQATGDTLELLQYYDNKLQAMQINVYLSGPNATSVWL